MLSLLIHSALLATLASAAQPHFSEVDDFPTLGDYLAVPTPAPVIGVLTQPKRTKSEDGSEQLYIAASYVKYVEAGGAQAVPVFSNSSEEELTQLFSKLNGLLVPGGGQDLRPGQEFFDAVDLLTNLAMQAYDDEGEVFPIQYTCLGWEAAAVKFTNNPYILSNFTGALGVAAELTWTPAAEGARSLRLVPPDVLEHAADGALAYEAHHYGIWLPDFMGTELAETFDLLSTTRDALGKVYVSTVQAKRYPFIATQWHPEKNLFEFSSPEMPHSLPAKQLAQAFANVFVTWAQLSTHTYDSEELKAGLIYNYTPIPGPMGYFAQVYMFNATSADR